MVLRVMRWATTVARFLNERSEAVYYVIDRRVLGSGFALFLTQLDPAWSSSLRNIEARVRAT